MSGIFFLIYKYVLERLLKILISN